MIFKHFLFRALLLFCLSATGFSAAAQDNSWSAGFPGAPTVTGRLFSPANGNGTSRPIALEIVLPEGWHTYWRNPGVAGAPPQLNWEGSTNFSSADILWPVPKRFTLEGLQTFGYDGTFILPLTVSVKDKNKPTILKLAADLVVCTDICVPVHFDTSLNLPANLAATDDIARWQQAMQRLPIPYTNAGIMVNALTLTADNHVALTATSRTGWKNPDVVIEAPNDIDFGKPEITLDGNKATFTLKPSNAPDAKQLPNAAVMLTFVDQHISADGDATIAGTITETPAAPAEPQQSLFYIIALALLGGLILNLMPCVLPVLSLKLLSVVQHAGETRVQIRRGFLATSLGIIVSFWLIAAALLIVKQAGMALGWGIQFQHPVFLSILLAIVLGFTGNLWGWFEINTPRSLQAKLGGPSLQPVPSARHEFFTGMLATLLATPCTAPFVGTSVGFALAGSATDILAIFTALGFGLALPYLLIAAFPVLAQRLPRPGKWMVALRIILGFALLATACWLLGVLYIQLGSDALLSLIAISGLLLLALWRRKFWIALFIGIALALIPLALKPAPVIQNEATNTALHWNAFEPARIPELVAQGKVVFVDITASWCLTCHANEQFVIGTDDMQQALNEPDIYLMRGDWTQPNQDIAEFLKSHKRAGIPFNLIAGLGAKDGVILPELLSKGAISEALHDARN